MKKVTAILLLFPMLAVADTHPTTEHTIVISASDMESGASILDSRMENTETDVLVAELFMFDSEAEVFMVGTDVSYVPKDEEITFNFRIGTHPLETADSLEIVESGCRTVLTQMATLIPDLISDVFVSGDATSHSPDELQRAVMDRTNMLCRVVRFGSDEVVTVGYSFADDSYVVQETQR